MGIQYKQKECTMDAMSDFNRNALFMISHIGHLQDGRRLQKYFLRAANAINTFQECSNKGGIIDPFKTGQSNPFRRPDFMDFIVAASNCPKGLQKGLKRMIGTAFTLSKDTMEKSTLSDSNPSQMDYKFDRYIC